MGDGRAQQSRAVEALRHTAPFTTLSEIELEALAATVMERSYSRTQQIHCREEGGDGLLVFDRGAARLFRTSPDGTDVTLGTFRPGDLEGVSAAARSGRTSSVLEATSDGTVVYVLARHEVYGVLGNHPHILFALLDLLGARLAQVHARLESMVLYSARTRLAHELADLALHDAARRVDDTHEQLAARIGSTQAEVTRGLCAFRADRLIESTPRRHGLTVLEPDRLAAYR